MKVNYLTYRLRIFAGTGKDGLDEIIKAVPF